MSYRGAYQTALFHVRKALELDPENLDYLQYLLFFYDLPDKLVKQEEALEIAQKLLKRDPTNEKAHQVLNNAK